MTPTLALIFSFALIIVPIAFVVVVVFHYIRNQKNINASKTLEFVRTAQSAQEKINEIAMSTPHMFIIYAWRNTFWIILLVASLLCMNYGNIVAASAFVVSLALLIIKKTVTEWKHYKQTRK